MRLLLAGGTGLIGPIMLGCNVIALCHDAHQKQHLRTALVQKVVEAALDGETSIFATAGLLERARKLKIVKDEKDNKVKDEKDNKGKKKTNKEEKAGKKSEK